MQKWGKNQIYSYIRPYYRLDSPLLKGTEVELLPPGIEIAEKLRKSDTMDFDAIEEITPGYFMKYEPGLFHHGTGMVLLDKWQLESLFTRKFRR